MKVVDDSLYLGDTILHFTKTSATVDSAWILKGRVLKLVSHDIKQHSGLMDISKYNEKGDLIEVTTFRYGQLQVH